MKNTVYSLWIVWILSINLSAQQLSSKAQISLLTISEGNDISDAFGHTAIRIKDDSLQIDTAFNYGVYDGFGQGFVLKFMRGQTDYILASDFTPDILRRYQEENRGVVEQVLNLNAAQKQALLDKLAWNLQPEHRTYRYEFFFNNCATKARDVLEEAIGKSLVWRKESPQNLTFRSLLDTALDTKPWWDLGIDLVLGSKIDVVASQRETMFLPSFLYENIAKAQIKVGNKLQPLVRQETQIISYRPNVPKKFNPTLITAWILCFFTLAISLYSKKIPKKFIKAFDFAFLGTIALLGVIIFLLWFFTEHRSTPLNWNILWSLPILGFCFGKKYQWVVYVALLGLFCVPVISLWNLIVPCQTFHAAVYPIVIALFARIYFSSKISKNSPL